MIRKNSLSLPLALFILGMIVHFEPLWYFDLWWQMADARWILQNWTFPVHNDFAYTLTNVSYICHEWLSGMVFYFIYTLFSARGLAVFCAIAFGLFNVFFFQSLPSRDERPWTAWLYSLLFLCIARLRFPLRPELFSNFLMLGVCALERHRRTPLWIYLAVFALWSNFHGQFVCGLAYLFICFATTPSKRGAAELAASCLGTFFNPYGWRIYEVPMRFFFHQKYEFGVLGEGVPNGFIVSVVVMITALTAVAVLWSWRMGSEGNKPTARATRELLLTLLFGWQTVKLNRLLVIFCIIAFPILYAHAMKLFGQKKSKEPPYMPTAVWGLAIALFLIRSPALLAAWAHPIDPRAAPVQAVDFLGSINGYGKVFNSFNAGGYLQWRLYPRIRTFCDSRSLGSTSLLYEGRDAHESPERWFVFMKRYDADFAFIDWVWDGGLYPVELGPAWHHDPARSPYDDLFPRTQWALIYWDQTALIFARATSKNQELIRRYELLYTEPLSWDYTLRRIDQGRLKRSAVRAELEEVQRRTGHQWVVDLMSMQLNDVSQNKIHQ